MRHLLRALARRPDPLSDAALLARYAADRDPAAFEVLVWRHGGLVLGVCRRHLRDHHAAEDAFQATFLVLARKAGTVRGETLAGWLHRVARRVAGRAAVKARRRRERPLVAELPGRPVADGQLAAVLDAEIDGLPDRQRQVVVLCYLDGVSTADTAARLGVPRGTVLSRLHAARATLAARLSRHGVTPPAVGLAAVLTAEQVAGGVRAAGGGVGPATILANEVLAMSGRKTVLAVAVGLVLAGGAGTGVGVLSAQSGGPSAVSPLAGAAPPPAAAVPPAEDKPPPAQRAETETLLRKMNARIAELQTIVQETSDLNRQIENAKNAIRFYESELTRLTARITTIQSQGYADRASSERERAHIAKEQAEELASNPEYVARARLLAELWQEKVRADVAGNGEAILVRRLQNATDALSATKDRLAAAADKARRERHTEFVQAREREILESLAMTSKEIAAVNALRKASENDILKWTKEMRMITSDHPDDLRDQLRRLRWRKTDIETGGALGTVHGDTDSNAKLDILVAEVRELRRLVEAKK